MAETVTWAQLDPFGQVMGTPFTGDLDGLKQFARKGVADLADFAREDSFSYYHHPSGRSIVCTLVTMTLPWGRYRYIPVDATRMAVRPRPRWGARRRRTA